MNTCVTCGLPEDRWDTTDPLHIEGASQCPDCNRVDLDAEKLLEHREVAA
ncbi:hypothetical protein [Micromonospora rubida]|nr:hypothetical protein [Micromonospora rubida]